MKKRTNNRCPDELILFRLVRTKGLEPPRRQTLDPKSSAATNYATCAFASAKLRPFSELCKFFRQKN